MGEIDRLTNGFQLPADACGSYDSYFKLLKEFSDDLHLHIHKENDILFEGAM
jgi:regulator of cell morphogenesis and NO signaling